MKKVIKTHRASIAGLEQLTRPHKAYTHCFYVTFVYPLPFWGRLTEYQPYITFTKIIHAFAPLY